MARRLIVDVSHNNGKVNWLKASDTPDLVGAMVKATQGDSFTDPMFVTNMEGAIQASLSAGAYAYAEPWKDPGSQMRHFIDVAVPHNPTKLAVDFEWTNGPDGREAWHLLTTAQKQAFFDACRDEIAKRFPECRPKAYIPWEFWNEELRGVDLSRWDLWIADASKRTAPRLPDGVTVWDMWQTGTRDWVDGMPGPEDMNVLNDAAVVAEAL